LQKKHLRYQTYHDNVEYNLGQVKHIATVSYGKSNKEKM